MNKLGQHIPFSLLKGKAMRVVTWNCRRATKEKDIWKDLQELSPDIMLLEEVSSFPNWIENNYIYKYEKSITKNNVK